MSPPYNMYMYTVSTIDPNGFSTSAPLVVVLAPAALLVPVRVDALVTLIWTLGKTEDCEVAGDVIVADNEVTVVDALNDRDRVESETDGNG